MAAVEFGLIAGLLFMILLGIFELGQIYSRYQVMQGAAREGARFAATRATENDVVASVVEAASPYEIAGAVDVSGACTSATSGQSVTVSWEEQFDFSLPFLPSFDFSRDIRGVFRCE